MGEIPLYYWAISVSLPQKDKEFFISLHDMT